MAGSRIGAPPGSSRTRVDSKGLGGVIHSARPSPSNTGSLVSHLGTARGRTIASRPSSVGVVSSSPGISSSGSRGATSRLHDVARSVVSNSTTRPPPAAVQSQSRGGSVGALSSAAPRDNASATARSLFEDRQLIQAYSRLTKNPNDSQALGKLANLMI